MACPALISVDGCGGGGAGGCALCHEHPFKRVRGRDSPRSDRAFGSWSAFDPTRYVPDPSAHCIFFLVVDGRTRQPAPDQTCKPAVPSADAMYIHTCMHRYADDWTLEGGSSCGVEWMGTRACD